MVTIAWVIVHAYVGLSTGMVSIPVYQTPSHLGSNACRGGCLNDGLIVETQIMGTMDLEGNLAISKSIMVAGGFWTIPI